MNSHLQEQPNALKKNDISRQLRFLGSLQSMRREQLARLSFVVALHGAALYGIWMFTRRYIKPV